MQETTKYTVFNIREYLGNESHGLGEDILLQVLSEFSCNINPDVERFCLSIVRTDFNNSIQD